MKHPVVALAALAATLSACLALAPSTRIAFDPAAPPRPAQWFCFHSPAAGYYNGVGGACFAQEAECVQSRHDAMDRRPHVASACAPTATVSCYTIKQAPSPVTECFAEASQCDERSQTAAEAQKNVGADGTVTVCGPSGTTTAGS